MQQILIFGKGQLGEAYQKYFTNQGWRAEIAQGVDIRNAAQVQDAITKSKPEIVLNAAAKTNIDWCEDNREEAFAVNTLGADNIGRACQEQGIYLIHLSSGCIQESKTINEVHAEEDAPNPLCFYSWTKVWAENLLMDRAHGRGIGSQGAALGVQPLKVLILRPRQLLSATISPRNALAKMLTYTKFIDTPNSATVIEDLLWATEKLIQKNPARIATRSVAGGANGIYNVANPGIITPFEIAEMLKEFVKPEMGFTKISKEELNAMTKAKRIDCVLSTKKLEREGIVLPEIHSRLKEILLQLKTNLQSKGTDAIMAAVLKETKNKLRR